MGKPLKVAFVMPTYFDLNSVVAGGERYAYGLAKAMSEKVETTLFTFGSDNREVKRGRLTVFYSKVLFPVGGITNPFSTRYLGEIRKYDVVHCLQYKTVVTELAVLFGKKSFVTDLAGGTYYCFSRFFPVYKKIKEFLFLSEYNKGLNPEASKVPHRIIYGGVDSDYFKPSGTPASSNRFLFVGRIFPLKGIHHLIEALTPEMELDICGTCHDSDYYGKLKSLAVGKKVSFHEGLTDDELLPKMQSAAAVVLPSLVDGGFTSALEAMACGVPVIGTRVGSLPEVVQDGETGLIIEPEAPNQIREKMIYLMRHPQERQRIALNARKKMREEFTWDQVAENCLKAYRS